MIAKLHVTNTSSYQNFVRGEQASQELEPIFKGTSIYINGYTDPPSSDLRRMILQHRGDYQHYCMCVYFFKHDL